MGFLLFTPIATSIARYLTLLSQLTDESFFLHKIIPFTQMLHTSHPLICVFFP